MTGDRISLDYSPGDRIVWLLYDSDQGTEQRNLFWLRDSFGIDDVREAIISTGWVEQQGGELRLRSDVRCEVLRDVVEAMLGYFELPGVPTAGLPWRRWLRPTTSPLCSPSSRPTRRRTSTARSSRATAA